MSITGPCYVGDGCTIRPGASISASSIGPVCKVGGELEGSIIHGYSNKQHDGFLGHSYVGEWVNLGADTVNSDLKNTYGPVRVPINGSSVDSGETFVGAFTSLSAVPGNPAGARTMSLKRIELAAASSPSAVRITR